MPADRGPRSSPSADVRAQAARRLGMHAGPVATAGLIALLDDPDPSAKLQAIIALGRIGDPSAVASLTPIVADPDVYLAHAARKALTRISDWPAIAKGLESTDAKVRSGVLLTLDRVYHKEAVASLAAFAESVDHDALERAAAVWHLASVYRETPPWDGSWWGTQPAKNKAPAKTIDWTETPVILESVHRLLDDPAPGVRIAAAAAISEIDDTSATALLRPRFEKEADPGVRAAFARTLGGLRDSEALPLLAAAIRDPDGPEPVRDAALDAVKSIGGEQATQVLLDVLADKNLSVERQKGVIAALGRFQAGAATSALVKSLDHAAPAVARGGRRRLGVGSRPAQEEDRRHVALGPSIPARRSFGRCSQTDHHRARSAGGSRVDPGSDRGGRP